MKRIPFRFREAVLDDFALAVQTQVRSFLGGNRLQALITGPSGVGKTHLAAAILNEWRREEAKHLARSRELGISAEDISDPSGLFEFVFVPEFLMEIRETWRDQSRLSERDVVDRYVAVRYLVMDDVGAEKTSAWSLSALYIVINRRDAECRPCIVTTNHTLDDIASVDARLASRLGGFEQMRLSGRDRRMRA